MAASTHTITGVRDAVLGHELLSAGLPPGERSGVQRDFSSSRSDAKAYMSLADCGPGNAWSPFRCR